jgi:hypothetical protein
VSAAHPSLSRLSALAAAGLLVVVPVASAAKTAPTKTTTTKTKTAPVGSTKKGCWSDLIKDWYDGRIDDSYPIHCYRDALKNLPQDVRTYSDAVDVINRALAAATRDQKSVDPDALIEPPDEGSTTKTTKTTTAAGVGLGGDDGGSSAPPLGQLPGDRGADGVPIPLIVLGALALLLVAAGGAGLLVRRLQARRDGPSI